MDIIEVLKSTECEALFNEVNVFVSKSLKEYNDSLSLENAYSDKDIFDFVWGTVELTRAEMIVLDSPLLQRLRRIHHLGMADVLYCNATSSRFSHTIGVVEVAGRMAKMVSRKLDSGWKNIKGYEEIVRMAAIFHDVGHMIYSHVSEVYFVHNKSFPGYGDITSALTFFCEKTSSECSLHELISIMIVNADETRRLFEFVSNYLVWELHSKKDYRLFTEYISGLIIGIPIDSKILPYSQIINGAIDADKLDYLSRDSESTKVPIAVDIARIIQKIEVVSVNQINFSEVWNDLSTNIDSYKIMGIKNSAKKVFFQLSSARSNMYESVYYHHKVMTAETMFRKVLFCFFKDLKKEEIRFSDILSWTDDTFSEYWKYLPTAQNISDDNATNVSLMISKLKNRNLYKRVAAFSEENLNGGHAYIKMFIREVIQSPNSEKNLKFIEELKEEYIKICQRYGREDGDENDFIFTFVKYNAMSSAPIENGEGCFIWSSALVKQETMEAGRKSKQEQYYVLTDCKERDKVYLAFEKVLYKKYRIKLNRDASICLKVSWNSLQQSRLKLLKSNYYKECLSILNDDIFDNLYSKADFNNVIKKYSGFQGTGEWEINKERLIAFLRQFLRMELSYQEIFSLIDGIFRLLLDGYFIDRKLFVKAANQWFKSAEEELRYDTVLLGNTKDSSTHLAYFLNDCDNKEKICVENSLGKVLQKSDNNDAVYFYDDGAYSGRQIVSIFQEYMGVETEKRYTNEHHVEILDEVQKNILLKKKIRILFVVFNENSKEFIQSELNKLGLQDVEIMFYASMKDKVFDKKSLFASEKQRNLVRDSLKVIGNEIVQFSKRQHQGWDDKRIEEAALGYNDAQQMVFTISSVPTYTIVPFWMSGEYHGEEWEGLFVRTDK